MKKFCFVSITLAVVLTLQLAFVSCGNGTTDDNSVEYNQVIYVEANSAKGFNYGYYYYIPQSIKKASKKFLLVEPNNYPGSTDDMNEIDIYAQRIINSNIRFATRLNVALLVPIFPRPRTNNITVTHALTSDTLKIKSGELKRIDSQLIFMFYDLKEKCENSGLQIKSKFLLNGTSASGQFTNRFTAIHPELVQAVASGAVTSMPILPAKTMAGEKLIFHVGVADLEEITGKEFDFDQYLEVPQFIYMGAEDTNDALPYSDSFSNEERRISTKILGTDIISRWQVAQGIIKQLGCDNITFKTYPGVGHAITDEIIRDIISFFRSNM
jgi:hypothetical protein